MTLILLNGMLISAFNLKGLGKEANWYYTKNGYKVVSRNSFEKRNGNLASMKARLYKFVFNRIWSGNQGYKVYRLPDKNNGKHRQLLSHSNRIF